MTDEQIKKKEEIESALAAIASGNFLETSKAPAGSFRLPQPTHTQPIRKRR